MIVPSQRVINHTCVHLVTFLTCSVFYVSHCLFLFKSLFSMGQTCYTSPIRGWQRPRKGTCTVLRAVWMFGEIRAMVSFLVWVNWLTWDWVSRKFNFWTDHLSCGKFTIEQLVLLTPQMPSFWEFLRLPRANILSGYSAKVAEFATAKSVWV